MNTTRQVRRICLNTRLHVICLASYIVKIKFDSFCVVKVQQYNILPQCHTTTLPHPPQIFVKINEMTDLSLGASVVSSFQHSKSLSLYFYIIISLPLSSLFIPVDQELFKEIDQEKDGEIYLKEVVLYLKALNQDMETLEVKHLLDQYELRGMEVLDFSEFVVRLVTSTSCFI